MNKRRVLYALTAGAVVALAPMLIETLTDSDPWRTGAAIFLLPGVMVGSAFVGGVLHWIGWQIIVVVNFAFYSGLAYLVLPIHGRLRAKDRSGNSPTFEGSPTKTSGS
jgi:MFS family permease